MPGQHLPAINQGQDRGAVTVAVALTQIPADGITIKFDFGITTVEIETCGCVKINSNGLADDRDQIVEAIVVGVGNN